MPQRNKYTGPLTFAVLLAATMSAGGCSKLPEAVVPAPVPPASVANISDIDVTAKVKTALHQSEVLRASTSMLPSPLKPRMTSTTLPCQRGQEHRALTIKPGQGVVD